MTTEVELLHRRGCPAVGHQPGQEGSRVERYAAESPERGRLIVTRCCDCAEQTVVPEEAVGDE